MSKTKIVQIATIIHFLKTLDPANLNVQKHFQNFKI